MKFLTISFLFCVLLSGCARIADPKPPEYRVLEVARDFEARQIVPEEPAAVVIEEARNISPPAPPANFMAIAENGRIVLFWTPSPSDSVVGYRIFRKTRADDPDESRRPLRKELVMGISHSDGSVEPDGDYIYEIQAVDAHGNASEAVAFVIKNRYGP